MTDISELGKCERYRYKSFPCTIINIKGEWVIVDWYGEIGPHLGSLIEY